MLMSGLKDTQIIILYLDYTSTITIYGVKLQQFKIDCKLFRYEQFSTLYQKNTIDNVDESYTTECMKAILEYQISLVINSPNTRK